MGVLIEKGPGNWEIIQQQEGAASIAMAGSYVNTEKEWPFHVWVRVVREETGEPVLLWTRANTTDDGRWSAVLERVPAGGLYRIETLLKEDREPYFYDSLRGDFRFHIGVGDLYVIAGQSNAAGFARDYIMDGPELGVHMLRTSGRWDIAVHPLNDSTDTIYPLSREPMTSGHSPFLSFGKYLHRELHYPIGLIPTALGGSGLEAWLPEELGDLYGNMLEILKSAGGFIRGMLWYQGCTDAAEGRYEKYFERFSRFVSNVRRDIDPQLPIFTIQLNRRTDPAEPGWDEGHSVVRNAQREAARELPGVYMIPSLDCTLSDVIHNNAVSNVMLGERLAKQVLANLYGRPFLGNAPDFKEASVRGTELRVQFAPVYGFLEAYEAKPEELMLRVRDKQGVIPVVQYRLKKDEIILTLERESIGTCTLGNAEGSNPKGLLLIDFETHYPVVAFSGETVRKEL